MTGTNEFDLVVLGGGMAGQPVAMKCAYSGMDVALVEEGELGGTCLNRGCIPTKAMLRSAEVANLARRSEEFGVEVEGDDTPNLAAIVDRKNGIVADIRERAYENVGENETLTLIEERGVFESSHELRVGDRTISGDAVVVNTGPTRRGRTSKGSRPWKPRTARRCSTSTRYRTRWSWSAAGTSAASTPRCTAGSGPTSRCSSVARDSSRRRNRP